MLDPLPANVSDFLALYAQHFPEVRFPELDLVVLKASAQVVSEAAARVADAESALETARAQLLESQTEMAHKAYRALAFLKLYAQDDEENAALLETVVLARPTKSASRNRHEEEPIPPRRRNREREASRSGGHGSGEHGSGGHDAESLRTLETGDQAQLPLPANPGTSAVPYGAGVLAFG